MRDAAHRPAAFINALAEEGTKAEAIEFLQKTWNELCDARASVEVQSPGAMEVVDREYYQGVIKELRASVEQLRAALTEIASLPDAESEDDGADKFIEARQIATRVLLPWANCTVVSEDRT